MAAVAGPSAFVKLGGKLPPLRLHHIHLRRDGSLVPVSEVAAESAWVLPLGEGSDTRQPIEVDSETCSASGCYPAVLADEEGCLVVTNEAGTAELLTICVLFAEVRRGSERTTGAPLIAIEARSEDLTLARGLWLVVVCGGGALAAKRTMASLSRSGAIRTDCAAVYDLDAVPLGAGGCADVYRGVERPFDDGADSEEDEFKENTRHASTVVTARFLSGKATEQEPAVAAQAAGSGLRLLPKALVREVSTLVAGHRHPNIVKFLGLFRVSGEGAGECVGRNDLSRWCLVMEHCCSMGGDLFAAVSRQPLPEPRARGIAKGLLEALEHLHGLGIMHRDVKVENVLLGDAGQPVLADFGIACALDDSEEMSARLGSPGYAAPEIYTGASYNEKADLFSTSVVLYFTISGKLPFHSSCTASTIRRTLLEDPGFDANVLCSTTARCRDFVAQLMRKAPDERPCAKEALRAAWISGSMTSKVLQHGTPVGSQRGLHGEWQSEDPRGRQHYLTFLQSQDLDVAGGSNAGDGAFDRHVRAIGRDAPWLPPPVQQQAHSQRQQWQQQQQLEGQVNPEVSDFIGRQGDTERPADLFERMAYRSEGRSESDFGEFPAGGSRPTYRLVRQPMGAPQQRPRSGRQRAPGAGDFADEGAYDMPFFHLGFPGASTRQTFEEPYRSDDEVTLAGSLRVRGDGRPGEGA